MSDLRTRFAYARTQRGYTQMALADAIGVTRGVISNIEYGKTDPPEIVINAVCNVLNINKEWLRYGTDPMEPDNERSRILDELYKVCANLTEPQQLFLLETIRAMQKYQVVEMEKPEEKHETTALRTLIESAESCSSKSHFRGKSKDREL